MLPSVVPDGCSSLTSKLTASLSGGDDVLQQPPVTSLLSSSFSWSHGLCWPLGGGRYPNC